MKREPQATCRAGHRARCSLRLPLSGQMPGACDADLERHREH
jgi:hypothetical protein